MPIQRGEAGPKPPRGLSEVFSAMRELQAHWAFRDTSADHQRGHSSPSGAPPPLPDTSPKGAPMTPSESSLAAIGRTFAELGLRWIVFGGVAANAYRHENRFTTDLDVYAEVTHEGIAGVVAAFEACGWRVRATAGDGSLARLEHPQHGRLDLCPTDVDYQREVVARAREDQTASGVPYRLATPEDVVVLKMIASRYKDFADVESILLAGTALDRAYLHARLVEWDVDERFREIERNVLDRAPRWPGSPRKG